MVGSSDDQGIHDWLRSLDDTFEVQNNDIESTTILNPGQYRVRKRNALEMDDYTPQVKKQRTIGLKTPRASAASNTLGSHLGRSETQSERSVATASSRSASPTKRQRDADIEYGKPMIKYLSRKASKAWKVSNEEETPILRQLIDRIQRPADLVHAFEEIESDIVEILEDVEAYKHRANEETWSDLVVLPTLRIARKVSKCAKNVHVINVKTISVWPTDLLPTNAQIATKPRKRVDYTIGLDITENANDSNAIVQWAENHTLSQCQHMLVSDRVLCSHIEIKAEGGTRDAQSQLGIWCAAQFRKQDNLWSQRENETHRESHASLPKPMLAPIPIWLWQGTTIRLWIAVIDLQRENISLLDEKEYRIDEEHPDSLREVIGVMTRVMQWGFEKYLPWFRALIGRYNLNVVTTDNVT